MSRILILISAFAAVALAQTYCSTGGEAIYCKDPVDGQCRLCTGAKYVTSCVKNKQYSLTFDDGPFMSTTRQLLDILDTKNVKATFFICGNQLGPNNLANVATLQTIYQKGHAIAAHSLQHKSYTGTSTGTPPMTAQQIRDDAGTINQMIFDAVGKRPRYVRPPYGDRNDFLYGVLTAAPLCYDRVVIWNLDSGDATAASISNSSNIVAWIDRNLRNLPAPLTPSSASFIQLQHDLHQASVDAVGQEIDLIRANGYEIVDLATCMGEPERTPYQDEKSECRTTVIKQGVSSTVVASAVAILGAAAATLLS